MTWLSFLIEKYKRLYKANNVRGIGRVFFRAFVNKLG